MCRFVYKITMYQSLGVSGTWSVIARRNEVVNVMWCYFTLPGIIPEWQIEVMWYLHARFCLLWGISALWGLKNIWGIMRIRWCCAVYWLLISNQQLSPCSSNSGTNHFGEGGGGGGGGGGGQYPIEFLSIPRSIYSSPHGMRQHPPPHTHTHTPTPPGASDSSVFSPWRWPQLPTLR